MKALETAEHLDLPGPRAWLAGDWHAVASWIERVVPAMGRTSDATSILHVGDLWPSDELCKTIDYWCAKAGITHLVLTGGNHEPWAEVESLLAEAPGHAVRVSEVVWLLPRPARLTVGGRRVLSVGGATSVDRETRIPGKNWWRSEEITDEQVDQAIAWGDADLLITHESPETVTPAVRHILEKPAPWIPQSALRDSAAGRARLERVLRSTRPRLTAHGHYHSHDYRTLEDGSQIVSLGCNGQPGNAVQLDLRTFEWEALPFTEILRR